MNDNNTHGENSNSEQPSVGATPTPPAGAGHDIPATFGSPQRPSAPSAPAQPGWHAPSGAAFGTPPQPTGYGTQPDPQPGHQPTQPTVPLHSAYAHEPATHTPGETAGTAKKNGSGMKVAGLLLAAALVGGVAGFGGQALGTLVLPAPAGESASGPQTITVNNPGSVNETTAIASEVLPSVVTIQVAGSQESGSGSGVILDKKGHILTNTHVVTLGGAVADPQIRVTTSDGRIFDATVVGTDPVYDLAVIKLKDAKDLTPIDFADSSKINVGDTAVAVGAPLGLSNSVTTGIVSALNRSIQVASAALPDNTQQPDDDGGNQGDGGPFQFDIPGLGQQQQPKQSISIAVIQTDAAINPGNSGGALVDSKGRLIGINVAIATAGGSSGGESGSIGVGFAIPSDIAQRVADEIISDGAATHGLLGATVRDASTLRDASVAGAVIDTPSAGGAAAKAGLRQGDIVTEFNGVPVGSAIDLTAQVRAAAAGSKAKVTYVRDGKTRTVEVTLGTLKL